MEPGPGDCRLISHKILVDAHWESWELNSLLFDIIAPYKKASISKKSRKRKRNGNISSISETEPPVAKSPLQLVFENFVRNHPISEEISSDLREDNKSALEFMDKIHALPYPSDSFHGENSNDHSIECNLSGETYLIPRNCRFYNKNVLEISNFLPLENQFDFIVMDPPWWNKYIRRINSVKQENGYKMLDNEDIKSLPIEKLISPTGSVAIWCTNSPSHKEALLNEMLPKWKLKLISTWKWMKVTKKMEPICDFHDGTGKQPFELLFIAVQENLPEDSFAKRIPKDEILVSVPSVIHSHKFPVFDVLCPFLCTSTDPPNCLEIFARYLQPNFTSIGLEVLKLQNQKLFLPKFIDKDSSS